MSVRDSLFNKYNANGYWFSHADQSTLYSTTDKLNLAAIGEEIGLIADKSGNDNDVKSVGADVSVPANTEGPTNLASGINWIGDNNDDTMDFVTPVSLGSNANFFWCGVLQIADIAISKTHFSSDGVNRFRIRSNAGNLTVEIENTNIIMTVPISADTDYLISVAGSGQSGQLWLNGISRGIPGAIMAKSHDDRGDIDDFVLGSASIAGGGERTNMTLKEAYHISTLPSPREMHFVMQEMAAEWGVTIPAATSPLFVIEVASLVGNDSLWPIKWNIGDTLDSFVAGAGDTGAIGPPPFPFNIYTNTNNRTSTEFTIDSTTLYDVEGAWAGRPIAGDDRIFIFVCDKEDGGVENDGVLVMYYYDVEADPSIGANWNKVILDGPSLKHIQDVRGFAEEDGSGNFAILYTVPGTFEDGGIFAQRFTGGDPTLAANWDKQTIVLHQGAHWMAHSGMGDFSGTGIRDEILFTSRNQQGGGTSVPGVFYLTPPTTGPRFGGEWGKETIKDWTSEAPDNDLTKCDWGDFFGNGRDSVVINIQSKNAPYLYDAANIWAETPLAQVGDPTDGWQVAKLTDKNGRPQILSVGDQDGGANGIMVYEWNGSSYVGEIIHYIKGGHPIDDAFQPVQYTDANRVEWIVSDSGEGDRVFLFSIADETGEPLTTFRIGSDDLEPTLTEVNVQTNKMYSSNLLEDAGNGVGILALTPGAQYTVLGSAIHGAMDNGPGSMDVGLYNCTADGTVVPTSRKYLSNITTPQNVGAPILYTDTDGVTIINADDFPDGHACFALKAKGNTWRATNAGGGAVPFGSWTDNNLGAGDDLPTTFPVGSTLEQRRIYGYIDIELIETGSPELTKTYDNQVFALNGAVNLAVFSNWANIDPNSFTSPDLPIGLSISATGTITGNMRMGGIIDCNIHVVGITGVKMSAGFIWYERL